MSIKAIIFGSTGMIGQAVLTECLDSPHITSILLINRNSSNLKHGKIKEIIHKDFSDLSVLVPEFSNYNTCYNSLGVSAIGLTEAEYHKVTYDYGLAIAEAILKTQKEFTYCYVSGEGTDSTEKGSRMWARVKGKLENKLLSMPFKNVYMFRPGYIQPMNGIKSRTNWYNAIYTVFKPLYYLLKPFATLVTDTRSVGKAMINVTLHGYPKKILTNKDINKLSEQPIS